MDESEAVEQEGGAATPIFSVYRRGYDPEQVDRYVADHQRRLDEALHRASESERKLAAAVGQLRELHRRVAVYESEARNAQPPALDSLGERVQRILQEAWEGAYNLRQEAEREVAEMRDQVQSEVSVLREDARREVTAQREQAAKDVEELRQVASREAAELVDEATRRALALRDEMERRRQAYLDRVERDRQRAVAQITYLYDQKQLAIAELARLQTTVLATIEEMVHSPLGKPASAVAGAAAARGPDPSPVTDADAGIEQSVLDWKPVDDEQSLPDAPRVALHRAGDGDEERAGDGREDLAATDRVATGEDADEMVADDIAEAGAVASGETATGAVATGDVPTGDEAGGEEAGVADVLAGYGDEIALSESTALVAPAQGGDSPHGHGTDPADVPTGPIDAIEYGYGYGRRTSEEDSAGAEVGATDGAQGEDREVVSRPRNYGGVYDAEADGWG
jgi:hypothetical protein